MMLVSHEYKFIYLKTIKTAGTSVEAYFEPFCRPSQEFVASHHCDEYCGTAGIVGYRGPDRSGKTWYNHMPANSVRRLLGEKVWNSYFKFCAVRNPWQKAISSFAFSAYRKQDCVIKPTILHYLRYPSHTSDQLRFLIWLRSQGFPIDRSIYAPKGTLCVQGVIRFERLENDMELVCRHIGVPWEPHKLPRFKSGIRKPNMTAKNLVKKPADSIIRAAYDFEIRVFGYTDPNSAGKDLSYKPHCPTIAD